jgi:hypothetical protein
LQNSLEACQESMASMDGAIVWLHSPWKSALDVEALQWLA